MSTKSIVGKEPVDIIIPTYDNLDQLIDCTKSIYATRSQYPMRFIIVNNGRIPVEKYFNTEGCEKDFLFVGTDRNLGWTGGLKLGLEFSTSKYVLFANDDIFVPRGSVRWLSQMVRHLELSPNLSSVGPASNVVMGAQNIFYETDCIVFRVPFLIGFCVLYRRSTLDEIGGMDEEFQTGDDLDLAIRSRKAGYRQICDSSIFVYHHGFQTGTKVHGGHDRSGGWNSREMTEETNMHLIRKHGFLEWQYLWQPPPPEYESRMKPPRGKTEDNLIKELVKDCDPKTVVDLGCGGSKTIEGSIGVDLVPKGDRVVNTSFLCVADIQADVQKKMPFDDGLFEVVISRHCLEHCLDVVGALQEWKRILSDNGKMILALPDERISDTIILNPEHVHAFTPDSLRKLTDIIGLKVDRVIEYYGDDSFIVVMTKASE